MYRSQPATKTARRQVSKDKEQASRPVFSVKYTQLLPRPFQKEMLSIRSSSCTLVADRAAQKSSVSYLDPALIPLYCLLVQSNQKKPMRTCLKTTRLSMIIGTSSARSWGFCLPRYPTWLTIPPLRVHFID